MIQIKSQDIKKNIWQYLFYIIAGISLISMIFASQDAGISGDEFFHTEHAEHVFNFYKTGGQDTLATTVTDNNNLPLYGQLIDNIAHGIGLLFNVDDYMALRHGLNSIVGFLAILFVGLFVKRVAGWRAGVFSLVLMLVSPRFIGHSFNNLKDIPFAAASMMSIYYIVKFLDELPKSKY
ncbi:MAG: glycosyltransferase family 39 protein, partial [Bacteroidales bacterium]